ncbi:MAG: outer membrane protein assembly factor BamA [Wolbachia endosymbiont of Menacanthus eurysternus]|nr:MAG: outer membrane protein assembly factor BamA [Wolbachia endosymbiont of Menacanthus eurysternus]
MKKRVLKKYVLTAIFILVPTILLGALEEDKKKTQIQIKDIKCLGNERISTQTIKFYTKLKSNSYINNDDINLIIKKLYRTKLFANINAYIDDKKNLVIKIKENPLINKISLKGNKLFKSKEIINNIIQSKPSTIFTKTKLQNDLLNLITAYRNNDRINTKIKYELDKLDNNQINLIFKVQEGKISRIKSIKFIGNKNFPESNLKQVINIQSNNNIFSKLFKNKNHHLSQYLLISEELLNHFYSSKGYINNNIQPIAEIDNDYQIILTFLIDEGKQYLFGSSQINFEESEIQDQNLKAEILKIININKKNNKVFNKIVVLNTIEKISKYLSEKGYISARVDPEYIEFDNVINVTYKVLPGKKKYINQITINGNNRTLDKVIRNKLDIVEGDTYNISEIQKSYKKLINTGFFESVKMDNYAIDDNTINLNLDVKEKNTTSLYLGGGIYFPGETFFKTDFKDPNLFGRGKEISFTIEKSRHMFSSNLEIIENNFNDSDTSLSIGTFYEKQNKPNVTFNSYNIGFSTKLSYKITENLTNLLRYFYKHSNLYLDNNNEEENISNLYKILERRDKYNISSIGYTLAYNKLDNLYLPKKGYLLRLNQDLSGLGGNVNFLKSEFLLFYTHPIIDIETIIRLKVAGGYIFSYTEKPLNVDQHFFKGGNEIRGFDLSGIGPRTKNKNSLGGKTYFNLTQQIDFPLSKLYNYIGIKGSFFIDYATLFGFDNKNKYKKKESYNDSKLVRVSPGFGFSIPSPFGGRFRLDFGFPLVKESYDIPSSNNIQFSIEAGI